MGFVCCGAKDWKGREEVSVQYMKKIKKKNLVSLENLIIWYSQSCLKINTLPIGPGKDKKGEELKLWTLLLFIYFQFIGRNKLIRLQYFKSSSNISINSKQCIFFSWFNVFLSTLPLKEPLFWNKDSVYFILSFQQKRKNSVFL